MRQNILGLFIGVLITGAAPARLGNAPVAPSHTTPAALCISPHWMQANRQQLSTINFQTARESLEQTLDAEGFSRDSFAPAFKLLDDLQHAADPNVPLPNWRTQLPQSSSWWFLVDRYFGQNPLLTFSFWQAFCSAIHLATTRARFVGVVEL